MLPATEVSGPNVVHYKDFNVHNLGLIVSLRRFLVVKCCVRNNFGNEVFTHTKNGM